MKKIMSGLIIMSILLVGCSNETVDKKEEEQVQKENPKEKEVAKEEGLNHEELMQNNRNSIAGEYVKPNGEVITINIDGTLNYPESAEGDSSNQIASSVRYTEDGAYEWDLNQKNSMVGGAYVSIFPIGVDITGVIQQEDGTFKPRTLSTNKDTVRMITGNGIPTENDVYIKK